MLPRWSLREKSGIGIAMDVCDSDDGQDTLTALARDNRILLEPRH